MHRHSHVLSQMIHHLRLACLQFRAHHHSQLNWAILTVCNSIAAGQQHLVMLCLLLSEYGAAFLLKAAIVALGLRGSLHVSPP